MISKILFAVTLVVSARSADHSYSHETVIKHDYTKYQPQHHDLPHSHHNVEPQHGVGLGLSAYATAPVDYNQHQVQGHGNNYHNQEHSPAKSSQTLVRHHDVNQQQQAAIPLFTPAQNNQYSQSHHSQQGSSNHVQSQHFIPEHQQQHQNSFNHYHHQNALNNQQNAYNNQQNAFNNQQNAFNNQQQGHHTSSGHQNVAAPHHNSGSQEGHDGGHADEHYYAHPKYTFEYKVEDSHTGDRKYQKETRDGDSVQGVYSLHEPDGSIRTVEYNSEKHTGFNAHVTHTGGEKHPQAEANYHQQGSHYQHQ